MRIEVVACPIPHCAHETLTTTKPGCYRPRVIPKLRKLYRRTGVGLSNDVPMEGCATAVAAAAA
jgi:hypothetical protein